MFGTRGGGVLPANYPGCLIILSLEFATKGSGLKTPKQTLGLEQFQVSVKRGGGHRFKTAVGVRPNVPFPDAIGHKRSLNFQFCRMPCKEGRGHLLGAGLSPLRASIRR